MASLTPATLKKEYEKLFDTCTIKTNKQQEIKRIKNIILANRQRYETVESATTVPWYVVAAIHNLESSLNFKTHLHNGDPLSARTTHVPKGRPLGDPPFTWEESAIDALEFDNMTTVRKWTLSTMFFKLEGFNGFGYRTKHPEVLTPYLWSFSNHYVKGKFNEDHRFDPDLVSDQCGAAILLKSFSLDSVIDITR